MAISESQRHDLHNRLDAVLGKEDAAVLMSHLPPSGWSDVARTSDLDARMAILDARFDAVDTRFDAVDTRFEAIEARFEAVEARIVHHVVVRMTAVGGLLLLADQALSRL